jgi:NAD(P)-dependent dehydrogenase (short-subunit alcohol dehydrogenase family)
VEWKEDMQHAELRPGAVILVTGGARGVSGRLAVTLAERYRCHLEIVGDSPLPDDEDEVLAACADAPTLRRLLVDRGLRSPHQIESETARILAGRETADTIAACERAGARVRYHACALDGLDADGHAFAALVDDIYERQGRIDGVVHDASRATLADKLRRDVRFIVFLDGPEGAPREALPDLARCLVGPIVSIVSPDRGDRGVARALDELGRGEAAQVLYMPDSADF